jgi:hypothetical protein
MSEELPVNSQGTQYPMISTQTSVTPAALTPASSRINSMNPGGQKKIRDWLEPNQLEIPAATTNASEQNETGELAVEANEVELSPVANDQEITENEIMIQRNEREIETTFTVDTNDLISILEIFTVVRERFHAKWHLD